MVNTLKNDAIPTYLINRDIVFFDGNCVLCHSMMSTLLKIDKRMHFLICAQQSEMGHLILERHGINVDDLSTIYIVTNCGTPAEQVLRRGQAALYILKNNDSYSWLAATLALLPIGLIDFGYNLVARNRYKLFGKHESGTCLMPSPEDRERIIG